MPILSAPALPTSLPPSGAAGGDLVGTFPNPTVGAGKITKSAMAFGVPPNILAAVVISLFSLGSGTYTGRADDARAAAQLSGSNNSLNVLWFAAADWALTGWTTKLNLEVIQPVNDTAPTATFTWGLYPVTYAGAGLAGNFTVGTVVTGSTVAPATTTDTINRSLSGQFTPPSDGPYCIAVVVSGSLAANSVLRCSARLRAEWV